MRRSLRTGAGVIVAYVSVFIFWLFAAVAMPTPAGATMLSMNIQGQGGFSWDFIYDTAATPNLSTTPWYGSYLAITTPSFAHYGSYTAAVSSAYLDVLNNQPLDYTPQPRDIFIIGTNRSQVSGPNIGNFFLQEVSITLYDPTANALASIAIPHTLTLSDWGPTQFVVGFQDGTNVMNWTGSITSITISRIPEPSGFLLFLTALGFLGFGAFGRNIAMRKNPT